MEFYCKRHVYNRCTVTQYLLTHVIFMYIKLFNNYLVPLKCIYIFTDLKARHIFILYKSIYLNQQMALVIREQLEA